MKIGNMYRVRNCSQLMWNVWFNKDGEEQWVRIQDLKLHSVFQLVDVIKSTSKILGIEPFSWLKIVSGMDLGFIPRTTAKLTTNEWKLSFDELTEEVSMK